MIGDSEVTERHELESGQRGSLDSFNPDKRIDVKNSQPNEVDAYNPDKRIEVLYTDREERVSFASHTDGVWSGEPGSSSVRPNIESAPGKAAYDKLREFGSDSIEYKDGVVDFDSCSVESVDIGNMTSNIVTNRAQAARAVADKWNSEGRLQDNGTRWTADAVNKWASNNGLEFHECSNMRTCQYVPKEIHSFFKHYGGRAECRVREMRANGGGFDE